MKSNGARSNYSKYNSYAGYNGSYTRNRYNARYNYTSEAFDYADTVQTTVRRKRKKAVKYSRVKEAAPLSLKKTYGTIVVIFCFVMVMLCLYASNSSLRSELVELQDRLVNAQEDNEYTRLAIDENIDLNKIQSEAMKLGLQMPAEYQIVEINVPKDSYAVQYQSAETETEEGFISFLKNIIKG